MDSWTGISFASSCLLVLLACFARIPPRGQVGIQPPSSNVPVHELSTRTWDALQSVNLKSYFLMSKFALPHMPAERLQGHTSSIYQLVMDHGMTLHVTSYAAR